MAWLVLGQLWAVAFYPMLSGRRRNLGNPVAWQFYLLSCLLISGVGAIGGFIVVGRMIIDDEVCRSS